MFKLDRKLIIVASVGTAIALSTVSCFAGNHTSHSGENGTFIHAPASVLNNHKTIDGGVYHPIIHGMTGPYHVNEDALKGGFNNGRVPTKNEIQAWDKDVMADGTGLPEGEGSVEDGEELYEAQCVSCHGDFGSGGGGYPALSKGNAYELQKTLKNQRVKPDADGPIRVFGSYWPEASTLWWYIRDGMPHTRSKTLTNDEVYALSAYILNINEFEIDGEEVDDEYVLNREKFLKIKMPNKNGFEPDIEGAKALENVRKYYSNPTNFGAKKVKPEDRCMTNCQKPTAKVVRIQNGGISDFHPPLAATRDIPQKPKSKKDPAQEAYEQNCMMCHADDSMGAPAVGNKAAWKDILAKGLDKVYSNGINGINVMPPKGGVDMSDAEFKAVVDYMIKASK
jgi:cytochrome c